MTRDFMLATLAALGLTACGPDLATDTRPAASAGAATAPPAGAAPPGGGDPTVAQAERPDRDQAAAGDPREDERKEDGQKPPR